MDSVLPEFSAYNGHFVSPRLAVGGIPHPDHLPEIAAAGVRCILNLVSTGGPPSFAYVPHLPESIAWLHLAFWDGWLMPDKSGYCEVLSAGYARLLVHKAAIELRDRAPVLIHCAAGIGRSGNLAAILLAATNGITPDAAIDRIRLRRPQVADFAHDGFWKNAGSFRLVELAAQVLSEPVTSPELIRERVLGETESRPVSRNEPTGQTATPGGIRRQPWDRFRKA